MFCHGWRAAHTGAVSLRTVRELDSGHIAVVVQRFDCTVQEALLLGKLPPHELILDAHVSPLGSQVRWRHQLPACLHMHVLQAQMGLDIMQETATHVPAPELHFPCAVPSSPVGMKTSGS